MKFRGTIAAYAMFPLYSVPLAAGLRDIWPKVVEHPILYDIARLYAIPIQFDQRS